MASSLSSRRASAPALNPPWDWVGLGVVVVAALLIRFSLFYYQTLDYTAFLKPWFNFIMEHGRFAAFRYEFYDYTPPYLYLMAFTTLFKIKALYAVKLISLVFEALLAVISFRLARVARPNSLAPHLTLVAILLLPTVILNGSLWGQCDAVHTAFIVMSLYCVLKHRYGWACLAYGVAISFKLQSIFVFPVLIILILRRTIPAIYALALPCVYLLAISPCIVAGRPFKSLLTIYFRQAGAYDSLTMNAPNVYAWLPIEASDGLFALGVLFAGLVTVAGIAAFVWPHKTNASLSPTKLLQMALLFALLQPFLLPKMHERYFYMADVLAVIYAAVCPRRWFLPVCVVGASFVSYFPFAFGIQPVKLAYAAGAMAFALLVLVIDCVRSFDTEKNALPIES